MNKTARIAGALYLVNILTGIFSLAYVPSKLSGHGDIDALRHNIMAHELLFRLGILAAIVCFTEFLFLPLVLYRLFKPVSREAALLMVLLAVVSVPLSLIPIASKLDLLALLGNTVQSGTLHARQLNDQVMALHNAYGNGMLVANVFWGLWLLPFGYLVFRSGFLPKFLGIALMIGCFGYLIDVFATVLSPGYPVSTISSYIHIPGAIGEIGIGLWLLFIGVSLPATRRQSVSPGASMAD